MALPAVYATGRVRYRDIWDIAWLLTQGAQLDPLTVEKKLIDYGVQNYAEKLDALEVALPALVTGDFSQEMQRFIAAPAHANRFSNPGYAGYFVSSVTSQLIKMKNHLGRSGPS